MSTDSVREEVLSNARPNSALELGQSKSKLLEIVKAGLSREQMPFLSSNQQCKNTQTSTNMQTNINIF